MSQMMHQELSLQECPDAWVFIYSRVIQVDNPNHPSHYYNIFVEMEKDIILSGVSAIT